MIAYLIDPYSQTVTEVEIPHELAEDQPFTQLQAIYNLLDCDIVEAVMMPRMDTLLLDEEARIREKESASFKVLYAPGHIFLNKALWLGVNREDWTEPHHSLFDLTSRITWINQDGTTHKAVSEHV